jgi:hypothetical protein
MDSSAIGSSIIAAVAGQVQTAVAGKLTLEDAAGGASAARLIDQAQQNIDSLVNVAAGIGTSVDKTV